VDKLSESGEKERESPEPPSGLLSILEGPCETKNFSTRAPDSATPFLKIAAS